MITASPSIRALIPRVSDIAHLHCGACSTSAQWNLCYCSYRWSMEEERQGSGNMGLEDRWRMLNSVEGGQRKEEIK